MGLLNSSDWTAKWISLGSEADGQSPAKYNVDLDFTVLQDAVGVIFGAQNSGNFYMWQINVMPGQAGHLHCYPNIRREFHLLKLVIQNIK